MNTMMTNQWQPAYPTYAPPGPPRPKRRSTSPVLIVLLLLAIALAGTFTTLYFVASSAGSQATERLHAKEKELGDAVDARTAAESKVDTAEKETRDAETRASDAESQVDALAKCRTAAQRLLTSLSLPESPDKVDKVRQALTEMATACR